MKSKGTPLPYEMIPELIMEISLSDIDHLDHVNNVIYLRWIQSGTTEHWNAIATGSKKRAFFGLRKNTKLNTGARPVQRRGSAHAPGLAR